MKILVWMPVVNENLIFQPVNNYVRQLAKQWCEVSIARKLPVTTARNAFFMDAYKKGFDYLLFIDDDNVPIYPWVLEKMIRMDKDVVTGWVRRKRWKHIVLSDEELTEIDKMKHMLEKDKEEYFKNLKDEIKPNVFKWFNESIEKNAYCVYEKVSNEEWARYYPYYKPFTWKVDQCWAGFCLIKRNVIEWAIKKYPKPFERKVQYTWLVDGVWYDLTYDWNKIPKWKIVEKTALTPYDSDVLFFERVTDAWFEIWANKHAVCSHYYSDFTDVYEVRSKQNDTIKYENSIGKFHPKLKVLFEKK